MDNTSLTKLSNSKIFHYVVLYKFEIIFSKFTITDSCNEVTFNNDGTGHFGDLHLCFIVSLFRNVLRYWDLKEEEKEHQRDKGTKGGSTSQYG